ncbi:MAG: hypothetical protein M0R17_08720 [Candidatus Omnitrophica bacterium]|jgi:allophanate hydrolase subunit 1|nr:hypothetical protein [Candidatus Omnitrophota bacterium]
MENTTKLTQDEINQLSEFKQSYNNFIVEFGQIDFKMILVQKQLTELNNQKSELEKKYLDLIEKENFVLKQFEKKYGTDSEIDLQTYTVISKNHQP